MPGEPSAVSPSLIPRTIKRPSLDSFSFPVAVVAGTPPRGVLGAAAISSGHSRHASGVNGTSDEEASVRTPLSAASHWRMTSSASNVSNTSIPTSEVLSPLALDGGATEYDWDQSSGDHDVMGRREDMAAVRAPSQRSLSKRRGRSSSSSTTTTTTDLRPVPTRTSTLGSIDLSRGDTISRIPRATVTHSASSMHHSFSSSGSAMNGSPVLMSTTSKDSLPPRRATMERFGHQPSESSQSTGLTPISTGSRFFHHDSHSTASSPLTPHTPNSSFAHTQSPQTPSPLQQARRDLRPSLGGGGVSSKTSTGRIIEGLQNELESTKAQLESARTEVRNCRKEISALTRRTDDLRDMRDRMRTEAEAMDNVMGRKERMAAEAVARAREAETAVAQHAAERDAVEAKAQQAIDAANAAVVEAEARSQKAEIEAAALGDSVRSLREVWTRDVRQYRDEMKTLSVRMKHEREEATQKRTQLLALVNAQSAEQKTVMALVQDVNATHSATVAMFQQEVSHLRAEAERNVKEAEAAHELARELADELSRLRGGSTQSANPNLDAVIEAVAARKNRDVGGSDTTSRSLAASAASAATAPDVAEFTPTPPRERSMAAVPVSPSPQRSRARSSIVSLTSVLYDDRSGRRRSSVRESMLLLSRATAEVFEAKPDVIVESVAEPDVRELDLAEDDGPETRDYQENEYQEVASRPSSLEYPTSPTMSEFGADDLAQAPAPAPAQAKAHHATVKAEPQVPVVREQERARPKSISSAYSTTRDYSTAGTTPQENSPRTRETTAPPTASAKSNTLSLPSGSTSYRPLSPDSYYEEEDSEFEYDDASRRLGASPVANSTFGDLSLLAAEHEDDDDEEVGWERHSEPEIPEMLEPVPVLLSGSITRTGSVVTDRAASFAGSLELDVQHRDAYDGGAYIEDFSQTHEQEHDQDHEQRSPVRVDRMGSMHEFGVMDEHAALNHMAEIHDFGHRQMEDMGYADVDHYALLDQDDMHSDDDLNTADIQAMRNMPDSHFHLDPVSFNPNGGEEESDRDDDDREGMDSPRSRSSGCELEASAIVEAQPLIRAPPEREAFPEESTAISPTTALYNEHPRRRSSVLIDLFSVAPGDYHPESNGSKTPAFEPVYESDDGQDAEDHLPAVEAPTFEADAFEAPVFEPHGIETHPEIQAPIALQEPIPHKVEDIVDVPVLEEAAEALSPTPQSREIEPAAPIDFSAPSAFEPPAFEDPAFEDPRYSDAIAVPVAAPVVVAAAAAAVALPVAAVPLALAAGCPMPSEHDSDSQPDEHQAEDYQQVEHELDEAPIHRALPDAIEVPVATPIAAVAPVVAVATPPVAPLRLATSYPPSEVGSAISAPPTPEPASPAGLTEPVMLSPVVDKYVNVPSLTGAVTQSIPPAVVSVPIEVAAETPVEAPVGAAVPEVAHTRATAFETTPGTPRPLQPFEKPIIQPEEEITSPASVPAPAAHAVEPAEPVEHATTPVHVAIDFSSPPTAAATSVASPPIAPAMFAAPAAAAATVLATSALMLGGLGLHGHDVEQHKEDMLQQQRAMEMMVQQSAESAAEEDESEYEEEFEAEDTIAAPIQEARDVPVKEEVEEAAENVAAVQPASPAKLSPVKAASPLAAASPIEPAAQVKAAPPIDFGAPSDFGAPVETAAPSEAATPSEATAPFEPASPVQQSLLIEQPVKSPVLSLVPAPVEHAITDFSHEVDFSTPAVDFSTTRAVDTVEVANFSPVVDFSTPRALGRPLFAPAEIDEVSQTTNIMQVDEAVQTTEPFHAEAVIELTPATYYKDIFPLETPIQSHFTTPEIDDDAMDSQFPSDAMDFTATPYYADADLDDSHFPSDAAMNDSHVVVDAMLDDSHFPATTRDVTMDMEVNMDANDEDSDFNDLDFDDLDALAAGLDPAELEAFARDLELADLETPGTAPLTTRASPVAEAEASRSVAAVPTAVEHTQIQATMIALPETPAPSTIPIPETPTPAMVPIPETPQSAMVPIPETPAPSMVPIPETPAPSVITIPEAPAPSTIPMPETPAPTMISIPETPVSAAIPVPDSPQPAMVPIPETPPPSMIPVPETPAPSMVPLPETPAPSMVPIPETPQAATIPIPDTLQRSVVPLPASPEPSMIPIPETPLLEQEPIPDPPQSVVATLPGSPQPAMPPIHRTPQAAMIPLPGTPQPSMIPLPSTPQPADIALPGTPQPAMIALPATPSPAQIALPSTPPLAQLPIPATPPTPVTALPSTLLTSSGSMDSSDDDGNISNTPPLTPVQIPAEILASPTTSPVRLRGNSPVPVQVQVLAAQVAAQAAAAAAQTLKAAVATPLPE